MAGNYSGVPMAWRRLSGGTTNSPPGVAGVESQNSSTGVEDIHVTI